MDVEATSGGSGRLKRPKMLFEQQLDLQHNRFMVRALP
ncbi:hypothetical protein CFFPNG_02048 [Methylorubrum aminovorans]